MFKLRPFALAIAASAMTVALIPFSAGSASADVPPPNVQPPGVPFGLCSVVDEAAESQENKCPEGDKTSDDELDDKDFPNNDDGFPFNDGGDDD